jgi:hypothetical protein
LCEAENHGAVEVIKVFSSNPRGSPFCVYDLVEEDATYLELTQGKDEDVTYLENT